MQISAVADAVIAQSYEGSAIAWRSTDARAHSECANTTISLHAYPYFENTQFSAGWVLAVKAFEGEFARAKGRLPRGADRDPLASTYAQYRGWKRGVRDQAATQVQSMYRGVRVRRSRGGVEPRPARPALLPPPTRTALAPIAVGSNTVALTTQKRQLKVRLKAFDSVFVQEHGRLPTRAEKEPIRALYVEYHKVKLALAAGRAPQSA